MLTLLIAVGSFVGYLIAYHTYGRWLSRKIFQLNDETEMPSHELRDDVDFVPTKRQVIFGHHFTSIAGTGPIVGPAIAVFWGWLPALIWVFVGSIFIGAVHDFGALVVSLRNRGQTVGEVAGRLISPRARVLFLVILFMALTVVLAIFGLVIASIFKDYPESVLPTWISLPLAVAIGFWVYKKGGGILGPSLGALAVIYGCVWLGAYVVPIDVAAPVEALRNTLGLSEGGVLNVITMWTFVLLVWWRSEFVLVFCCWSKTVFLGDRFVTGSDCHFRILSHSASTAYIQFSQVNVNPADQPVLYRTDPQ